LSDAGYKWDSLGDGPMSLYLPVLYGTVRNDRKSIHVARYATARLAERSGVETRLFDPVDLPFGNLVHRVWEWPDAPETVRSFVAEMERAQGFVIVTPEYNFGIPGTLKNLLDHLHAPWRHKPFGLIGCGGLAGGARAVDSLRMIIPGLRGVSIPTAMVVPQVATAFSEEGPTSDGAQWDDRFDGLFAQLEWYARALSNARKDEPPPG
jgi:NAD(P)H-dependent FMN reductase